MSAAAAATLQPALQQAALQQAALQPDESVAFDPELQRPASRVRPPASAPSNDNALATGPRLPQPGAPPASPWSPDQKLGRRHAVLLVAAVVALVLGLAWVSTPAPAASAVPAAPTDGGGVDSFRAAVPVVLGPGDTLWEVAREHAPPGIDTRSYLEQIRQLNGLDGGPVATWTVVELPAR